MSELLSKYQDVVKNPPKDGDILTTFDKTPVVLTVQVEEGKPPFIYARAYVSEILDQSLGWYLRGVGDDRQLGWKCVLMTKARRDAMQRCTVNEDKIHVKALRVVRVSASGNSLLCEVAEYLPVSIDTETTGSDAKVPEIVETKIELPQAAVPVQPDEDAS